MLAGTVAAGLRALIAAASIAAAIVAPSRATAQPAGPCPEIYPDPVVGEYARVRFVSAEGDRSLIRFAVVGTDTADGGQHYWVEVVSEPPGMSGEVVVQMLIPFYPFDTQDIKGYIVQMPGAVPQRVPRQLLSQMLEASATPGTGWRQQCESARLTGTQQINVPAGSFRARHYEGAGEAEVWLADVPFGIIKLVQPQGTMELVEYGTDARSSLSGEPEELQIPPPGPR